MDACLLVGLGNPGVRYQKTRHNIGFMALDRFAKQQGISFVPKPRFDVDVATCVCEGMKMTLLKPHSYMNVSGIPVARWMHYMQVPVEQLCVIVDDLHIPFGSARLRTHGSNGGHNGIKSIENSLGTSEFKRVRFGIGLPKNGMDQAAYVLARFTQEEQQHIQECLSALLHSLVSWVQRQHIENDTIRLVQNL